MASGGESGYPSKRFLWQSRDRSLAKLRLSDNVRIVGGGEGGESRLESSGEIGGGGGAGGSVEDVRPKSAVRSIV